MSSSPISTHETADSQEQTPLAKQEVLLKDAKKQAELESYRMRRALDKGQLEEALKHSAKMLNELRTNALSPKNYYDLYMTVFDQLRYLEMYFDEERSRGRNMQDLYEVVQHAGNIVPRLYLLITVGSVYIKSKQVPAKDILRDLVEMCKGVQHPTRGLFMRNYLSQIAKDKLPDTGSDYEGFGGNVEDAIAFILQNFNEMVFLFSRLKNEGPVKERQKREKERYDLRILIGTNLVRLSQLDGVSLDMYKEAVLPKILEIVIKSFDKVAQQYLMESIIQVFPDEYHIATLHTLLQACLELHVDVDLKSVFTSLMDRLANYAKQFPEQMPSDVNIIEVFSDYIEKTEERGVELSDNLSIQISLMTLALQTYPDNTDYVNKIINNIASQLNSTALASDEIVEMLKRLLLVPLESYNNVLTVLKLEKYGDIIHSLGYEQRKFIALSIVRCENYDTLSTKTCQYSSKLLRKPDQCRAGFTCSHLFWPFVNNEELQNSSKALECLQWSLKIVKACMPAQQIPLFVDILNVYAYHFDKDNDKVTAEYINGLIDLIANNISKIEEEETPDDVFAPTIINAKIAI